MKLTLDDLVLRGKRVLVRIDGDVPVGADGAVADDRRLAAALPTLRKVLRDGGKPIVLAHRGDPRGHRDPALSLEPVARRLGELLGPEAKVTLAPDATGVAAAEAVMALRARAEAEVLLLENARFHPGETEGDLELAREWASMGDVFVNEAVDASRRGAASIVGIPQVLRSAPGYLLAKEAEVWGSLVEGKAPRPITLLAGGADLDEKLPLVLALFPRLDALLVAGALAVPFLAAKGQGAGSAAPSPAHVEAARRVIDLAETRRVPLVIPVDHFVSSGPDDASGARVSDAVPDGAVPLDIGPKTATLFRQRIEKTKTLLWCGPVGRVETKAFSGGSRMMAMAIGDLAPKRQIIAVACGGSTAAAVQAAGVEKQFSYVSLEGGALLEAISGKELPGLQALRESHAALDGGSGAGLDSFAGPVPASFLKAVAKTAEGGGANGTRKGD